MRFITTSNFRLCLLITAVLIWTAAVVWAQNQHFIFANASFQGSNVVVSFKEAGLGDNQRIDFVASADATATFQCVNHGGQCPDAANKVTVVGPVTASGTFVSGKNGHVTASLTLTNPGPGDFSCPPGQNLTLADVGFSNIRITDTTNNVSQSAGPSAFSATFFTCP